MLFFILLNSIIPFLITYKLTPIIINYANRKKIFDEPDYRKKHNYPTPRIGGISIFLSFLISLISIYLYKGNQLFVDNELNFIFLFICFLSFFLLGFIDDLKSFSPFIRLFFQFIISTISWFGVIKINGLYFSFNYINEYLNLNSNFISYFFTVFWTVGVINAINWIDGMDSLLIGLTCIYSFTFAIIYFFNNSYLDFLLSIGMFFACLGFLKYNKNPSLIMAGDGGSYLIGYYLSISTLSYSQNPGIVNPFLLVSLLFIPLIDMVRVIILRLFHLQTPFLPDRKHFHYLLLDNGISQKNCLLIIFFISLCNSIFNIIVISSS